MTRRLTRRQAIAAVGGVSLAGCITRAPQYWENPPSFDTTGLDGILDEPIPDRPQLVSMSFESAVAAQFVDRVERLVAPIPDPLPESRLPNSAIRSQITTERRAAREQLPTRYDDHPSFGLAERFVEARCHAATAVGTWAAVTTEGEPTEVTDGGGTVRSRVDELGDSLPGRASDPVVGAAVYGSIERWLDVAERRTLFANASVSAQEDPLRAGRTVGEIERIQSQVEVGGYLQAQYLETVEEPQAIDEPLRAGLDALGSDVEEWLQALHDEEEDRLFRNPGTQAFFDRRPVVENAPSLELLSQAVRQTFEDLGFDPIAFGGYKPTHPATTLCRTMLALVRLSACDELGGLIEDGEDLFPEDGATVDAAREEAIGSVSKLSAAASPLQRWLATQILPLFDEPETILSAESPTTREITRAYTEYRWISLVASESESVASTASEALTS